MEPNPSANQAIQGVDSGDSFNFKCSYCSRNLSSRQNLKEHLYIHTGERPFKCEASGCGKTFRQGSLYSIHKKSHEKLEKKPEKCRTGLKSFKLTDFLVDAKPVDKDQIENALKEIGENFNFIEKYLNSQGD